MRVAIGNVNLTAVLITLIICVTLYSMCKMARQDDAKKAQKKSSDKVVELQALKGKKGADHEN